MSSSSNQNSEFHGYPFEEDERSQGSEKSPTEGRPSPLKQIGGDKRPGRRGAAEEEKKKTF